MCKIITDHKWKPFKYSYEIPENIIKRQFDHLDEIDKSDGFIVYHKRYYHLSDFMTIDKNSPFANLGFDGYLSDSFFSGILIKISNDCQSYKIATYIS